MTYTDLVGSMPEAQELEREMERQQALRDAQARVVEEAVAHYRRQEQDGYLPPILAMAVENLLALEQPEPPG